ncbi:MAG: phage portal protein family protein [Candidatus Kapaibacteriota bacterium]
MKRGEYKEKLIQETYNLYYRLTNLLPNPDTILQKIGRGIEVYRELKNDAHVWSCIQSRKSGVLSLPWTIEQNDASSEVFDFVLSVFDRLDVYQIESDILEAPLFGFQPIEIIWETRGNRLVPRDLKARQQEWFAYDSGGNLVFKGKYGEENRKIPPYKIINVQHEATAINPYGHSLLAKCYWPVTFKNGGLRFWVNFTERYGMPILIGQYQRGATNEEIKQLASDLDSIYEDAILVAPMDVKLELHEPNRSSSVELYLELIRFANNEISKAILSQTLTTELEGGSYAASQTHFQIRKEIIIADSRLVQNALNLLIRYMVELNFDTPNLPKFKVELQ